MPFHPRTQLTLISARRRGAGRTTVSSTAGWNGLQGFRCQRGVENFEGSSKQAELYSFDRDGSRDHIPSLSTANMSRSAKLAQTLAVS